MQSLQINNTSTQVTIPKDDLRRDGVIEGDFPDDFEQNVVVDRLGEGQYLVRLVNVDDEGRVPNLLDAEAVKRAAAQYRMEDNSSKLSAD